MKPDSSPEIRAELLDDFYAECAEHLANIREALALLEGSVGKVQADLRVLEELFRNFHSFKGISALVGLRPAEELAHAAEDFLRELSRGRATLTLSGLELLMGATQKLEQTVAAFRAGTDLPENRSVMHALREIAGMESRPKTEASGQEAEIEAARGRGLVLWRCTFVPNRELDARGININSVRAQLSAVGEILRAAPQVLGEGVVAFEFILGTRETPGDIADWEADGIKVELLENNPQSAAAVENHPSEAEPAHSPFIAPSHVVRVDLNKLDDLMRIAGEMVIQRSRFEQQLRDAERSRTPVSLESMQEVNGAFSRSLRELRQSLMRVRLVPVAEIFARMPFVVRDLARDSEKEVALKLDGQQTELDKYLIERLKDPLLHLVRNAFSHAVESPEERVTAGKPATATIWLCASSRGDSVLIDVKDDGRGIDAEMVARRAARMGIPVKQPLDSAALLKILCSPGFSTRDDVDRAAGRGVGMAVVYNTVRELGGSITLETEVGKGTKFTLRLPLTLAVSESFIVSCGEQTCAIPQTFVSEVLQVDAQDIRTVNRIEVIPYRSGVLPIIRLSKMFRVPGETRERNNLLVLSSERGSTGLVVDRIHGQREVVVRAIRDKLVQVPGVIGATELGDGRPVLILDGEVLTSGAVRPHSTEMSSSKPEEIHGK